MAVIALLVTVACFSLVVSEDIPRSVHCDVPNKSQLEDKLHQLIGKLPGKHLVRDTKTELLQGAIFLGLGSLYRLDTLKPDRPFKTFCRGDDIVTLFSLRSSRRGIDMEVPWKLCSGHNGTIRSSANHVRYEGEMVTRKTGDGGTESVIGTMTPVMLETMDVRMSGGGEVVDTIVNVLGYVLSGPVRIFWAEAMTDFVRDAFQNALRKLN